MMEKIKETADFLASFQKDRPRVGMITGTGLGAITANMEDAERIPFHEIPNFSSSTVAGHKGTLVMGRFSRVPVIALEGRFHLYEGFTPREVAFPVRVMARMGIEFLFISSAAGGLNPEFMSGEFMIVTDHINLTGKNPLVGGNVDSLGPRFPDMSEVYSRDLVALARRKAVEAGFLVRQGVYVGILGPSLETPAETRFLRMTGADAVGMSTVTEVIAGAHCGLDILAIVVITNVNLPDCMQKTSLEDVIRTSGNAGKHLGDLWSRILMGLDISA